MLPDDILKTTGCSRFSRLKISDQLSLFRGDQLVLLAVWKIDRGNYELHHS
jgi:hypothetical protein